ncbi:MULTISPECIES: branched-chain amino acid ABC transporter permease [unclassified Afipia]|uniref:branched-chain amino acid ABC transporter permease n=1 Tax=unclassified Afipia TaxID=2642050 RepID=UPI00046718B5|nr:MULTISPECIES: branched-chain amino acid ABC transporter permease [unclassified Afipia]
MNYFFALFGSGLAVGAVYGLVAIGFAVVYKATRVINFAHGEMMMLNAYLAHTIAVHTGVGFWALVPIVIIVSIVVGLLVEVLLIRPMIGEPTIAIVMMTVGLAIFIRSLVVLIWGASPLEFPPLLGDDVLVFGPIRLYLAQVIAIGFLVVIMAGFAVFYRYTRSGIAMRAAANNETVALLMGIDVRRIYALAWALAAATAGLAGLLVSAIYEIGPDMSALGLRAFPATIMGGLDAVGGSAIGGFIIGILENLGEGYIGRGMKEIVGFAIILVVLMIRPFGLFGTRDVERV